MKKTRIVLWVVALTLALSGLYGCGKPAGGGTLNQTVEISFSTQSVRLVRGDERYGTQSLVAQVRKDGKDDETAAPVYAVENPAVASYADGVLTAVGKGKTVLTATLGEKSASVTVEVSEKIESLQISDRTHVKYYGRVFEQDGKQWFHNTASGFEVSFIGTTLSARLTVNKSAQTGLNELRKAGLKVYVDDLDPVISDCTTTGTTSVTLTLARDLPQGLHTVTVRKMTEQAALKCAVEAIECDGEFVTPKASAARKFEFYGDSITCGYGNLWTSDYNDLPDAEKYINDQDGTQTYVTMTSEYFGAEYSIVSYSGLSAALPVNGLDYTPSRCAK